MSDPLHPDDCLPMWVVYARPADYPHSFTARLWQIGHDGAQATPTVVIGPTLEAVRQQITPGLYRLDRHPFDAPCIVETWI